MSSNVSESGKKQESADSVLLIAERDKYLQENSILLGNARQILEKVRKIREVADREGYRRGYHESTMDDVIDHG